MTSLLKGQYGKSDDKNTPRLNYNGIGAENKTKKSKSKKNLLETSSEDENEKKKKEPENTNQNKVVSSDFLAKDT